MSSSSSEIPSIPPLSPLYRGPFKVLSRYEKFFILQISDKSDLVSMDGLKAVFSSVPVTLAVPPPQGHTCLLPASVTKPPVPVNMKKKVRFEVPVPATKLCLRFEVFHLSPLSSGLTFWGEYLWLLR